MTLATVVCRHTGATRILHWINALSVFMVLMSGLQIFNAHPQLHWGNFGADNDPAVLIRGFPHWATIPSYRDLASGRRWHFFFAWILVMNSVIYLIVSFLRRHVQRDLMPTRAEFSVRHFLHEIWEHARLKFPRGEAARHYNLLQKLTYLAVIFVLGPIMLGTGLTMSPGVDAAAPWLLTLFGGRQSARTIHFVAAMLIVLFIIVHLLMVVLAGPLNEIRSMITGRYRLPAEKPH